MIFQALYNTSLTYCTLTVYSMIQGGSTALIRAVVEGHAPVVKLLLAHYNINVDLTTTVCLNNTTRFYGDHSISASIMTFILTYLFWWLFYVFLLLLLFVFSWKAWQHRLETGCEQRGDASVVRRTEETARSLGLPFEYSHPDFEHFTIDLCAALRTFKSRRSVS